ncbi:hypothetical protein F5Y19DRAFT_469612 [Xylariaceae sp. FL1651]|nr:hypothetical protein F5Y19DRAFT_469612 [Xylariaceae sp. FL1651]
MAKSSRASSRKANNQRLKAKVFGPVEIARNERLSAKLLELAAAPKPERETMNIIDDEEDDTTNTNTEKEANATSGETAMDVDIAKSAAAPSSSGKKGRISKRRKTSKIVFPKYGDKNKNKKRKN